MAVRKVLIVGAGIGGLTAAAALKKAGIDSLLVESNPAWSVYGVGIIQPSNMLRALDRIGLARRCVELGGGFPGWQLHDSQGNSLGQVPNENVLGDGFPPCNGITRPLLQKVLADAARTQGSEVRLGVSLASWQESAGGVEATLTNGERVTCDLVIGADGAHSQLRQRLFGGQLRPTPTGQSVWRYNLPRPPEVTWGHLYFGATSKAGLVPLSPTLMYILVVTMEPGNPRMPEDQLHTLLRQRLAEYGGLVSRLRDMITDATQVVYRPLETVFVPPPWHKGRVVLIGDAAHSGTPHLAQGAAMAIEDAVLLAEMLNQDSDLDATLVAFTARRLPRCQLVLEAGLQLGRWEMADWSGRPEPGTDHGGLLHRSLAALMQPA